MGRVDGTDIDRMDDGGRDGRASHRHVPQGAASIMTPSPIEQAARVIAKTAKVGMVPISPDHVRSGLTNPEAIAQALHEAGMLVPDLTDANVVHINMLRGGIAKPTPTHLGHLYRGDEAREAIAEIVRQNPETGMLVSGEPARPTATTRSIAYEGRMRLACSREASTGRTPVPLPTEDRSDG